MLTVSPTVVPPPVVFDFSKVSSVFGVSLFIGPGSLPFASKVGKQTPITADGLSCSGLSLFALAVSSSVITSP